MTQYNYDDLKNVSLSHATMRPEDLIPTFIAAIRHIESDNIGLMESMQQIEDDVSIDGYFESENSQFDLDYLFDTLNTIAPDGYYFGSHPGDGSEYGFWESESDE